MKNTSRRDFIKTTAAAASTLAMAPASYGRIIGANDRVRVGVVGFSSRFKSSLLPAFLPHNTELNFEIVGISLDKNRGDLDRYITSNKIVWPQFFDGKYYQNAVAVQYGVNSIPTTYLIDRNGRIRYKSLRGKSLETAVEQLVAENS